VAIEQADDTSAPRRNLVRPPVGNHPRTPERSIVTIPSASARVKRAFCTTPCCPKLGGHRPFGRYKSIPLRPGAPGSGRRPAKARGLDGDNPQVICASANDLLHRAMVSPIEWPSTNWAKQNHLTKTGCVRELLKTREIQSGRWCPSSDHPRRCKRLRARRHGVPIWVSIEQLEKAEPPHKHRVRLRVGDDPQKPERSMVTIPRACARVH